MTRNQILGPAVRGAILAFLLCALSIRGKDSGYLPACWRDYEGIPESSVLAVAQTPDGYLWVGSPDGLLRFNGVNFDHSDAFTDLARLTGAVNFLETDHGGRLWAVGTDRLAVYYNGAWHPIDGVSNLVLRSVAESGDGRVFLGGLEGQLYSVVGHTVQRAAAPPDVSASGVFCIADAKDGQIWLVNKGYIGRSDGSGWTRFPSAPPPLVPVIACRAQTGGVWVYTSGHLAHYGADGSITRFAAPIFGQAREILEDESGIIWIASISNGIYHFYPGGEVSVINTGNGLLHNSIRCITEDREGNIWAGGYMSGLNRFKPRHFVTIERADGLPDNAIQAITELSTGEILAGTHGSGIARIAEGKVQAQSPDTKSVAGDYIWSLIQDRNGRIWIGTFNDGLFYQENGVTHPFPVPAALGSSINRLMQDSRGRIWVGGSSCLGVIQSNAMIACFTNSILASTGISALAEDSKAGKIWVGTHISGVFQIDSGDFKKISPLEGFDGQHITSLTVDNEGYLWIGIYEQGLACYHDGRLSAIGQDQGLPVKTVGAVLDDGLGWFWLGSSHGILRVARNELQRLADPPAPPATFNLFNAGDGLESEYCNEGYQPNALRDHSGHLWFGTDRGVVTLDPALLRLNTNPPPVFIDSVTFTDRFGTNHLITHPTSASLVIPPGGSALEFVFSALSFTAPEKVAFRYQLGAASPNWVRLGHHRSLILHELAPGHYVLRVTAANNDGVWNADGVELAFVVRPYLWQMIWFRLLAALGIVATGSLGVWLIARQRYQRRIDQLQRQRKAEQELAAERQRAEQELKRREEYFRSLIENASDSITVIRPDGTITYQSTSGERVLGYPAGQFVGKNLFDLIDPNDIDRAKTSVAQAVAQMGQPVTVTARLRHRDGSWRFIETVGTCIRSQTGEKECILNARDITENLKLEEQLRQSQKMEAVGQLAGGVAHDFNNILSALILQTDLLETTDELPDEVRDGLRQINADSRRAANLTRQLLLFGRRQVMQLRLIDLNEIVANLAKMLQRIIREDIRMQLNLHGTPLLTVADAGMIEQVLINLAVNARDAMAGGGQLTIETSPVSISAADSRLNEDAKPGHYVCLRVADTGGGIPPQILPHIFEPFFTTKEPGKGTGLGLATVFGIVKQHKGWVKIDNHPGKGAAFNIILPAGNAPPPPEPDGEKGYTRRMS